MGNSESNNQVSDTFFPGKPPDSLAVLRLFAVASRVVCAKPESFSQVSQRLGVVLSDLVPPESLAAEDCAHLWKVFSQFASHPKPMLREEASKALCRDLDAMGQRLQLPPLPAWEKLPVYLVEEKSLEVTQPNTGRGIEETKVEARLIYAALGPGETLPIDDIIRLLSSMEMGEREVVCQSLIGAGHLSRSEVALLTRWVAANKPLKSDDELIVELLQRVGAWLVK